MIGWNHGDCDNTTLVVTKVMTLISVPGRGGGGDGDVRDASPTKHHRQPLTTQVDQLL